MIHTRIQHPANSFVRKVVHQIDTLEMIMQAAGLPHIKGFCLAAEKDVAAYGGPYHPVGHITEAKSYFLAVVAYQESTKLRTAADGPTPVLVMAIQENGIWNDMLSSASYLVGRIFCVLMTIVCLSIGGYQVAPIFGEFGPKYNIRSTIYFAGMSVLLSK
jgi:hypothetical protein